MAEPTHTVSKRERHRAREDGWPLDSVTVELGVRVHVAAVAGKRLDPFKARRRGAAVVATMNEAACGRATAAAPTAASERSTCRWAWDAAGA